MLQWVDVGWGPDALQALFMCNPIMALSGQSIHISQANGSLLMSSVVLCVVITISKGVTCINKVGGCLVPIMVTIADAQLSSSQVLDDQTPGLLRPCSPNEVLSSSPGFNAQGLVVSEKNRRSRECHRQQAIIHSGTQVNSNPSVT